MGANMNRFLLLFGYIYIAIGDPINKKGGLGSP